MTTNLNLTLTASTRTTSGVTVIGVNDLFRRMTRGANISGALRGRFGNHTDRLRHVRASLRTGVGGLRSVGTNDSHAGLRGSIVTRHRAFTRGTRTFRRSHTHHSGRRHNGLIAHVRATIGSITGDRSVSLIISTGTITCGDDSMGSVATSMLGRIGWMVPSVQLTSLTRRLSTRLRNSNSVIVANITSVRSTRANRVAFVIGPGCHRRLNLYRTSTIIVARSSLPFTGDTTLMIGGPCLACTHVTRVLSAAPRPTRGVTPDTIVSTATGLNGGMSVNTGTIVRSNIRLNSGIVVNTNYFMNGGDGVNTNSHL